MGETALAFTIWGSRLTSFYPWSRGIATLFSLLVLKDAPPTPLRIGSAALVLFGIAVSARSGGE